MQDLLWRMTWYNAHGAPTLEFIASSSELIGWILVQRLLWWLTLYIVLSDQNLTRL